METNKLGINPNEKKLSQNLAQQLANEYYSNESSVNLYTDGLTNSGTQIIIHVCDENKKLNKDFRCEKNLLISNMRYFEKYLSDSKTANDIDISVHCDIGIFDWLMTYIHKREPVIEVKNAVSILISSDFLQMKDLVEKAL